MIIFLTGLHSGVRYFLTLIFLCGIYNTYAQKQKADSLEKLLTTAVNDTTKVILMWQMADAVSMYQPDTALKTVQQALFLAKRIKYTEGESRSLGITAEVLKKQDKTSITSPVC